MTKKSWKNFQHAIWVILLLRAVHIVQDNHINPAIYRPKLVVTTKNCCCFFSQPNHVFKRTVSMRWFYWVPKTNVKTAHDGLENINNFTLKFAYINLYKSIFLHGNSLWEAVWSRKIHVQIMRFTCCLNITFTWESKNWALICIHDVTLESVAAVTDHFTDAFVHENVARIYMT